jgi:anhydro-N-acetylmuramic acid kinase
MRRLWPLRAVGWRCRRRCGGWSVGRWASWRGRCGPWRRGSRCRRVAGLSREFALLHIEALRELVGGGRVDLVAVHGQTVFHAPPVSWQLLCAAPIAQALGAPVVFDLRAADLAAGGQGAPITPLADYVFFRDARETRGVLNLGGFCNYTWLPRGAGSSADAGEMGAVEGLAAIRGGDICACNQLLDALARTLLSAAWDEGGRRALAGRVQPQMRDELLELLRGQAAASRSLGTGDELRGWIERRRDDVAAQDVLRCACDAIAAVAAERIGGVDRLIVAGGGVRNGALRAALSQRAAVSISDDLGVPAQGREAAAMAVLGALCQDRVPITLPQITGCREPAPVAGVWVYP